MRFSLLLLGAPYSTQSATTAYRFADAALKAGHDVYRVFFYHDAVSCGNRHIDAPHDEINLPDAWATLSDAHGIDLVVCVASALKRGVFDDEQASRYDKACANLTKPFHLSGLGQFIDAALVSDRFITFGP